MDGQPVDYGSRRDVRAFRERCAIVFQQYNLFQNMTALDNVTVTPIASSGRRAMRCGPRRWPCCRVGLRTSRRRIRTSFPERQQQRVAIARALALRPEFLLLDEVTAALDPELVTEVLDLIRQLAGEGMTMLVVSHEMNFVREISTRVVFMADGLVVEEGSPRQVFEDPQAARTREFVGKILRH